LALESRDDVVLTIKASESAIRDAERRPLYQRAFHNPKGRKRWKSPSILGFPYRALPDSTRWRLTIFSPNGNDLLKWQVNDSYPLMVETTSV
jgi:hypothetical protein